jgi:hypothetical protein
MIPLLSFLSADAVVALLLIPVLARCKTLPVGARSRGDHAARPAPGSDEMRSALLVQQLIAQLAFLAPERLLILLIIPALISCTSSPASARTGVACALRTPRTPAC